MSAGTRPLLRFLPWLLASAAAHAVLLVQWPAGTTDNPSRMNEALQVRLLRAAAPAAVPAAVSIPPFSAAHPAATATQLSSSGSSTRTARSATARQRAAEVPATTHATTPVMATAAASTPTPAVPAGTQADSATAPDSAATDDSRWSELMTLLHRAIDRNKRYPQSALYLGREGSARIDFRLGPDGRIEDLAIGDSSGVRALDVAAYRAVRDISPFPEANRYLDRTRRFQVDVVFRLN